MGFTAELPRASAGEQRLTLGRIDFTGHLLIGAPMAGYGLRHRNNSAG